MQAETFEQKFKTKFKNDIQELLGSKELQLSNDVSFKPFDSNPECVVGIIKGGNGHQQLVEGFDLTSYPVSITFILEVNFLQEFLGLLNTYISLNNNNLKELSLKIAGNDTTFKYKELLSTPSVLGSPVDLRAKEKIIRVATVVLNGEISYSSNAILKAPQLDIKITNYDGTVISGSLKGLVSDSSSTVPQMEQFYIYGSSYAHNVPLILTNVRTINCVAIDDNEIHNELSKLANGVLCKQIEVRELPFGWEVYSNAQITKDYTNGVLSYNLVMGR